MDRQGTIKNIGRIGILAGVAAFLAFGLMQGALVGGTVGLETGAYLFGGPDQGEAMMRILSGLGMLMGVTITCAMFVACGLAAGRVAGILITAARPAGVDHDAARHARLR